MHSRIHNFSMPAGVFTLALIGLMLLEYVCLGGASDFVRAPIGKIEWGGNSDAEKRAAYSALFADEDWVRKVWEHLSNLVVQARFDHSKINALNAKLQRAPHKFDRADLYAIEEEHKKRALTIKARDELSLVLDALGRVRDQRVIGLIGPLLLENDQTIDHGDSVELSIQAEAATAIRFLIARGVEVPLSPERSHRDQDWREWWVQNKERFGPVRVLPLDGDMNSKAAAVISRESGSPSLLSVRNEQQADNPGRTPVHLGWVWAATGVLAVVGIGCCVKHVLSRRRS